PWDGKRWARDTTGEVYRRAKRTVRAIHDEAKHAADDEQAKALGRHAVRSESRVAVAAMVKLAETERGIAVTADEFDRDSMLLNVQNGTVDLRTGQLRRHDRADLITKLVPVPLLPDATCPIWMAFLQRVMAGKPELIRFLQRATGYALTGD